MKNNPVGRPKKLNRQHIINVAFDQYWLHGINNVSLSTIAKLANVSRPGIYVEFGDEDALQAEVIKKYIKVSADPVHNSYNDYENFPDQLFNHMDGIINDGNPYVTNDKNYFKQRPKGAKGCLVQISTLNKHTLGPVSKKLINDYEQIRINQFEKYINNAKNDGVMHKNIDANLYAKYILAQFSLIQTLKLQNISKSKITSVINIALKPLLQKNKQI